VVVGGVCVGRAVMLPAIIAYNWIQLTDDLTYHLLQTVLADSKSLFIHELKSEEVRRVTCSAISGLASEQASNSKQAGSRTI